MCRPATQFVGIMCENTAGVGSVYELEDASWLVGGMMRYKRIQYAICVDESTVGPVRIQYVLELLCLA